MEGNNVTSLERMIVKVCQTINRHREAATVEEQLQPAIDPLVSEIQANEDVWRRQRRSFIEATNWPAYSKPEQQQRRAAWLHKLDS